MELKQLQTIRFILEEGSFLKAAEKLGYVQSTITLHIQQLEDELGIKLFKKSGRKMILSQEGAFFWTYARPLLEHADSVKEVMKELISGQSGHIRIGAIETVSKTILTPQLIDFCKCHPNAKLSFDLGGTDTISHRVASKQLDLGICSIPPAHLQLSFQPLFNEGMDVLLPLDHPLVQKENLILSDLSDTNIVLSEPLCSYRAEIEQHFVAADVYLKSSMQIGDINTIIEFVRAGMGCAILPVLTLDPLPPKTVKRNILDAKFGLTIGIIRRRERLTMILEKLYAKLLSDLAR